MCWYICQKISLVKRHAAIPNHKSNAESIISQIFLLQLRDWLVLIFLFGARKTSWDSQVKSHAPLKVPEGRLHDCHSAIILSKPLTGEIEFLLPLPSLKLMSRRSKSFSPRTMIFPSGFLRHFKDFVPFDLPAVQAMKGVTFCFCGFFLVTRKGQRNHSKRKTRQRTAANHLQGRLAEVAAGVVHPCHPVAAPLQLHRLAVALQVWEAPALATYASLLSNPVLSQSPILVVE